MSVKIALVVSHYPLHLFRFGTMHRYDFYHDHSNLICRTGYFLQKKEVIVFFWYYLFGPDDAFTSSAVALADAADAMENVASCCC